MLHWCRVLCVWCCKKLINPCGGSHDTAEYRESRAHRQRGEEHLCTLFPVGFGSRHSSSIVLHSDSLSCRVCIDTWIVTACIPSRLIHTTVVFRVWLKLHHYNVKICEVTAKHRTHRWLYRLSCADKHDVFTEFTQDIGKLVTHTKYIYIQYIYILILFFRRRSLDFTVDWLRLII